GGHRVIERIGHWRSLWIGAIGMSVGALLLSAGRSPTITIGAAFLMGLVGSLILTIVPAALSDRHGEMRTIALTEANVIASLVVTTAPLMVGQSVRLSGDWRFALAVAAIAPIFLYIGFRKGSAPTIAIAQKDSTRSKQALPILFWVYWAAIVMAVSVEFCMIFWSADYLKNVFGLLKTDAAQAVSLFLAAMILGRMAGSRLVQHFSTPKVITVSIFAAGLGFILFWKTDNVLLGLGGLFLTGLGVASLYPLILALAIGTTADTIQASARATLASGTAILALPLLLARLADAVGIGLAYGVVAVLLLGVFLIIQFADRISSGRSRIVNTGTK
ncbi:MAG: MFS transporter, partial [Chloroflexota bacterium]